LRLAKAYINLVVLLGSWTTGEYFGWQSWATGLFIAANLFTYALTQARMLGIGRIRVSGDAR
jgi:hypothetical protein